MKIKTIAISIAISTLCATARVTSQFDSWDGLEGKSSVIAVVNCGKPTSLDLSCVSVDQPSSDSNVSAIAILKGTTTTNSFRLQTDHELWQGENYLIYGTYSNGCFQAYEEYRVIPLGSDFSTNMIAGRSLRVQIERLLKHGLFVASRRLTKESEEKNRLETISKE